MRFIQHARRIPQHRQRTAHSYDWQVGWRCAVAVWPASMAVRRDQDQAAVASGASAETRQFNTAAGKDAADTWR